MLRLPHRLLSQPCTQYGLDASVSLSNAEREAIVSSALSRVASLRKGDAAIVVADNVAAYLDGTWVSFDDVEPVVSPFSKMLLVWRGPDYRGCREHGAFFETAVGDFSEELMDVVAHRYFALAPKFGTQYDCVVDPNSEPHTSAPSSIISATCFHVDSTGTVSCAGLPSFFVVERGCVRARFEPVGFYNPEQDKGRWALPALMAVAFMNCKNVTRHDASESEGPSPKWCRRQRVPELKYHVLQIDPNLGTKPRPGERKTEGDRSGKALHICRGHFAHYVDDGVSQGLFGKGIFGTFWVPMHTRGSLEQGRVVSTYHMKTPVQKAV